MDGILRFLRVTLHVGFALLLAVAVVQLMASSMGRPARYIFLALALLLAAVYLLGTVAEKRFAAGALARNPGRYALLWLGLVTVLWAVLLTGSAAFSWLVFPLFFLHLHFLPRWAGFAAVAVMTAAVIGAQWAAAGGLPMAAVLGPVFGAAFAVVTSMAYHLLYRNGESQRLAADELRRTRAELSATQHEAGVLAERARLAREIHDTLAQGFSSIILVSRAAGRSLESGDLVSTRESIDMVAATASESLAEARSFVRGLSSPALEGTSLVESLRRLCEKTQLEAAARGVNLACTFRVDGEPVDLPQPYRVTLLRAAQASLANVWLHAKAGTAVVSLAYLGTEVALDVFDDGRGFEPATLADMVAGRADGSGFGLKSLADRVEAQHGTLALESAPGEGTVVAIRLPLDGGAGDGNEGAR
ncbi:histidine kinase [Arthrobacter sp. ERGS1:01]|uniref:sensor histidine kinase n=1 Tax=Arthrobacter sp. ERGS1:01 TaxID=1704044 RepID=UPI0006B50906|nr:sensor histidine kinase [Arthrobacter sp. ERGS1:01]ALE08074.1 histidine kinase [Arthrobacter sp. ERGS1:01]